MVGFLIIHPIEQNLMKRISSLLFLITLCALTAFAQYSTDSKRAISRYETAVQNYRLLNYQSAIADLRQAVEIDQGFVEAHLLLAQVYTDAGLIEESIKSYEQAISIDPLFFPNALYFLAGNEFSIARYKSAKTHLEQFFSIGSISEVYEKKAQNLLAYCELSIWSTENPVPFEPVNLGPNVNSEYDEYWPSLSADENILVFTVLLPIDESNPRVRGNRQEDFFFSVRENGQWSSALNAGPPLNTPENEGAQSISSDGKQMFFTACGREDSYGMCDIYFSEKKGDNWTVPRNLGPAVNTKYSEKQPSISPDGRALYFTSNRPGGKGKYDLWVSHKNETGKWQTAINLGDSINTSQIDQSPFIHPDNKSLYFSSDGWPGLGGFDLFVSRKNKNSGWSNPRNLGYPINTHHHEEGLIVNARGNKAYFSSNRLSGRKRDIFEFELHEEVRPVLVSYMKGKVYDAKTKKRLEARFELIDLFTAEVVIQSKSESGTGEFLVTIPADADYALNVSKEGYMFYSDNFSMEKVYQRDEPFLMDIPLQPIHVGEKMILRNIFFAFDSYELDPKSKVELNKVIEFLRKNSTLVVEISGHTDNVGSKQYNQELSENRARSVVDYLFQSGIPGERMTWKGYGLDQPVDTNETEEGRAKNRRTELKILSE